MTCSLSFNLWWVVKPAEDLPGQWVVHCLDLDVVTQGESIPHAITMGVEACQMVLEDDLGEGRDPLDRRAPNDYWDEMYELLRRGRYVDAPPQGPDVGAAVALVMSVQLRVPTVDAAASAPARPPPVVWTAEPVVAHG
jgi:predicted RNase H-like HicB family nuclease